MNLLRARLTDLFYIDFNIILPSVPSSYKRSFYPEVSTTFLYEPLFSPIRVAWKEWENLEKVQRFLWRQSQ